MTARPAASPPEDDPTASAAPLWARVHSRLEAEIAEGRWRPGDRLPSETALARRFGVNRHTLRRAMARLREDGILHVRRGAGATVAHATLDYPLGPRMRFSETLRLAGRQPGREFLSIETLRAARGEAEALELPQGAPIHAVESLNRVDGAPVAHARACFPADRLPDLPAALRRTGSITAGLAACGVRDYERRWTRLIADRPGAIIARHLEAPETVVALRAEGLSADADGRPVEYGLTWFLTDRMPVLVGSG